MPEIALAQRAADRKKLIAALQKRGGDLATDYGRAVWTAEAAARVGRACGDYPLLGGGDANVYSLFVERASHLVKPGASSDCWCRAVSLPTRVRQHSSRDCL